MKAMPGGCRQSGVEGLRGLRSWRSGPAGASGVAIKIEDGGGFARAASAGPLRRCGRLGPGPSRAACLADIPPVALDPRGVPVGEAVPGFDLAPVGELRTESGGADRPIAPPLPPPLAAAPRRSRTLARMTDIRVRIAPSQPGRCIWARRTALFNFLFARHTGGTFIFRWKTRTGRVRPSYELDILNGMHWLDPLDEGRPRQ